MTQRPALVAVLEPDLWVHTFRCMPALFHQETASCLLLDQPSQFW